MGLSRRFWGWLALAILVSSSAAAVDLVVTTNTSLPAGTYTYGAVTIKTGATLTLLGDTAAGTGATLDAATLTVESGATLSADGQGYAAGLGPSGGTAGGQRDGGGGGGHGGDGGTGGGTFGTSPAGPASGSPVAPAVLGSGGGSSGAAIGAKGGGAITIRCTGAVSVQGTITANGANGTVSGSEYASGGGAGGALVIEASSITGSGTIRANGGNAGSEYYATGGGGSGGRILVRGTLASTVVIQAAGGTGYQIGAAGTTLMFANASATSASWRIDNLDRAGASTPIVATVSATTFTVTRGALVTTASDVDADAFLVSASSRWTANAPFTTRSLRLETGSTLTHAAGGGGIVGAVDGDVFIDAFSSIDTDGCGLIAGAGAGPAGSQRIGGGGGGHGGLGARGAGTFGTTANAPTQGVPTVASAAGFGGGSAGAAPGGRGGGTVWLDVTGTINVDGSISATGAGGGVSGSEYAGGGGAGGSITLIATSVVGYGVVRVNGGAGASEYYTQAGSGSGGRMLLDATSVNVRTEAMAGGSAGQVGGAGTVLIRRSGFANGLLTLDNGGRLGVESDLPTGASAYDGIAVSAGAHLRVPATAVLTVRDDLDLGFNGTLTTNSAIACADLFLRPGALLTHEPGQAGCRIDASGRIVIDTSARVNVDSRGATAGAGVGPAGSQRIGAGGGAYGGNGLGGTGTFGTSLGGAAHETMSVATALGSAGGSAVAATGGRGGGRVELRAGASITVDGDLSARGANGVTSGSEYAGGGGSGGAFVLVAPIVQGRGRIAANGGGGASEYYTSAGSGAGGRIVIDAPTFAGLVLEARGGTGGAGPGGAGTVLRMPLPGPLTIDNGGAATAAYTPLLGVDYPISSVTVSGGARLSVPAAGLTVVGATSIQNASRLRLDGTLASGSVVVASGGVLDHSPGVATCAVTTTGDLTVAAGGTIDLNGKGHPGATGPGKGVDGTQRAGAGGGGHGGVGGTGSGTFGAQVGGPVTGTVFLPDNLGSGGGAASGSLGGAGGGTIRITASGTIVIDGTITALGQAGTIGGSEYAGGGGAGGSITLVGAGGVTGAGSLSVDGGGGSDNYYCDGGAGAAGRIRIAGPGTAPTATARGGTGPARTGGAGTVWLETPRLLRVDNGGRSNGETTPLPVGSYAVNRLEVGAYGNVVVDAGALVNAADEVAILANGTIQLGAELVATVVSVRSLGTLAAVALSTAFHIRAEGRFEVDAGGLVTGVGRGAAGGTGTGPGATGSTRIGGGGGGHGCTGGTGGGTFGTVPGGAAYGDPAEPALRGSGGGNSCGGAVGGAGGALLRFSVRGPARVDGTIDAGAGSGNATNNDCAGGGGSGGTIALSAASLSGAGVLTARGGVGGDAYYCDGGGGAGGRIAVHAGALPFTGTKVVTAGTGYASGCAGTVVTDALIPSVADLAATPGSSAGTIDLVWTSPVGIVPASQDYDIRVATTPITDLTFEDATPVAAPSPAAAGTVETSTLSGLVGARRYYIAMRILDAQGRSGILSNVATAVVTGDGEAPETISNLTASAGVDLAWTAPADVGTGVDHYELRYHLGAGAWTWAEGTPVDGTPPASGAPGSARTMTVTTFPSGFTYSVAVRAVDASGNAGAMSNRVLVDRVVPTITITSPPDGIAASRTIDVAADASDNVAVVRITATVAGTPAGEDLAAPWRIPVDVRNLAVGSHTITLTAQDAFDNTASDTVTVTVAASLPTAPVITAPSDGLVTVVPAQAVSGRADAGDTVTVLANGAPIGTATAVGARRERVEAEAPENDIGTCQVDASGTQARIRDDEPVLNVAFGRPVTASASYSTTYGPAEVVDGKLETASYVDSYWLAPNSVTGATLTVDLGGPTVITQIRLLNSRNGTNKDRSTKDYRLSVSEDGQTFVVVHSGVLADDDITNFATWTPVAPPRAQFVRFHADTYFGAGAGLSELEVLGSKTRLACSVTTGDLLFAAATSLDAAATVGTANGGTIGLEYAAETSLFADSLSAAPIDDVRWSVSSVATFDQGIRLDGTTAWGPRFAFGRTTLYRSELTELIIRVTPASGRNMVGLRRPGGGTSYTGLAHALYFDLGTLRIYEDGTLRGDVGSYSNGTAYDVRFVPGPNDGMQIWSRVAGSGPFGLLYSSTYATGQVFQPGITVYEGTHRLNRIDAIGRDWKPAAEIAGADATKPVRLRATLTRPSAAATSPLLDAMTVDVGGGASTEALGTFRLPPTILPEGDVVLTAEARDSQSQDSPLSAPVTIHIDSVPPATITDLAAAKGTAQGEVVLTWTAPGDDGATGTAASYEIRYATAAITAATWPNATPVVAPTPGTAGSVGTATLTGLVAGTRYYAAILAIDDLGNRSGLSNVASELAKDTSVPSVTFSSPADGAHVRGVVTVTVSASDNVAVSGVELFVDTVKIATDLTSPYELTWTTTSFAQGARTVRVEGYDAEGNRAGVTRTITVDNTVPTVSLAPVTTPTGIDVTLSVTAADNLTLTAELVIRDETNRAPPFTYLTEGAFSPVITVTDKAGNTASATLSFVLDESAPSAVTTLAATSPAAEPTRADLTWTAPNDSLTAVTSYEIRTSTQVVDASGTGADGDLVVSSALIFAPVSSTLAASALAGASTITLVTNPGLVPGDEVLLYVAQCDTVAESAVGRLIGFRASPLRVVTANGATLTLSASLPVALDATACTVIIQEVPNFASVRVAAGATLSPSAFSGTAGGLLALRVKGTFRVEPLGAVVANAAGFRGSPRQCIKNNHGLQGETYLRRTAERNATAVRTAGGGGTGGAPGTPGHDCAGGGGGGHATSGVAAAAYSVRAGGGGGSATGNASLDRVNLGGGGGQGGADEDGGSPGGGGAGGGAVLITAGVIDNDGTISVDGSVGQAGSNGDGCPGSGCGMGGGGGGAGGSILLSASAVDLSGGITRANGGAGGLTNGCGTAGGAGSAGRIRVDAVTATGAATPVAFGGSQSTFDWDAATPLVGVPTPGAPGSAEAFTWNGALAGITHYFALRSTNAVGLVSSTSNIAVRDGVSPSVTIVSPVDGVTVDRPLVIEAASSDDVGVARVEFQIDGVLAGSDTAAPYEWPWNVLIEENGPHTLTATAFDAAGRTGTHTITVTVALTVPPAPVVTGPRDGAFLTVNTATVVGQAAPGSTVVLTVNGTAAGTAVATNAASLVYEAEALTTTRIGCIATDDGRVEIAPPGTATNVAAGSTGGLVFGSTTPAAAIDGDKGTSTYWYTIAEQNETLYYLGRVVLPRVEIIDRIDMLLWNGDARSYYNYKLVVSRDAVTGPLTPTNSVVWADRSGSGVDYKGLQSITGEPTAIRTIDVYLSGNTINVGAHIIEIEAFRATGKGCIVEPTPLAATGALYYGQLAPTETLGGGAVEHEVRLTADAFFDDLNGQAFDPAVWWSALSTFSNGIATLGGTSVWGSSHAFVQRPLIRGEVDSIEFRVRRNGNDYAMLGLARPNGSFAYPALPFSIYLYPSGTSIYEDGSSAATLAAFPTDQWIDLRIQPGAATGAVYSWKLASATTWTTVFTSTRDGGAGWLAAISGYTGSLEVDSVRVTGPRWLPASELAGRLGLTAPVRTRSLLTRPAATDVSPSLDKTSLSYTTGAPADAGIGLFRIANVALVEGANTLRATATDAGGTSPSSQPVVVNVDSGPPSAITDLTAVAQASGVVLLQWSQPNETPAHYTIWRSLNPITTVEGLTPIGEVSELSYGDLPTTDATYHYVVTSTDVAGNRSAISNDAVVSADTTAPKALAITLSPVSPVGAGTVTVTLTASEQVSAAPSLSVTLPGTSGPVVVTLSQSAGNTWTGSFVVPVGTASGTATWSVSLVDLVGNAGTGIIAGATFLVDTTAPTASIALSPVSPLKAGTATVTVTFNEAVSSPTLSFTPSGKPPVTVVLAGSASVWTGSFAVTSTTGDGPATFAISGTDLRGNTGTTLTAGEAFTIDANAPAAPTLTGVKAPAGYFVLSWSTLEPVPTLTYKVRRAPAPCADMSASAIVQTVTTATTNDQAPVEGLWCYAVFATDTAGNVGNLSNTVQIQSDPPPPEEVTALALVDVAATALEVSFTGSANSAGLLAGYRAYVGGALVATLGTAATSHRFQSLQPSTAYTLRISAFDSNGKESIGQSLVGHTWVPQPTGVVALGKTARIEVSWNAVPATTSLLQYAVYLETAPFSSVIGKTPAAANPGGTTLTLTGLNNGTTYYVAVVSVNKSNAFSPIVTSYSATPGDNEAPAPPTTLTVTNGSGTTLALAWPASVDPTGDLAGYEILRNGTLAATVGPTVLASTLSGLAPATAYTLAVRTFDTVGNRSALTTITGYTVMSNPSAVTLTPHHKSLGVSWAAVAPAANLSLYRVYVLPASFTDVTPLVANLTSTATSTTVAGLQNGTRYYVAVTAVNKSGLEQKVVTTVSAIPADDAPPEPPTQVRVTASTGSTLTLAWNASANSEGDLANYRLSLDGGAPTTVTGTLYTATGLLPSKAYAVTVKAADTLGNLSTAGSVTAYTWWPNPSAVAVTQVKHEALILGWTPPAIPSGIQNYAVYVSSSLPFTSVVGLTPKLFPAAGATSALITGLPNGTPVYMAVVTVTKSGGFDPAVVSVSGTPQPDTAPPVVTAIRYSGALLAEGGTVAVDGSFRAEATDDEGLASARFFVDDALLTVDTTPASFDAAFALEGLDDGAHVLRVEVTDVHGNTGTLTRTFTILLAAPPAPSITAPANGFATNKAAVLVQGKARAKSLVRVYVGSAPAVEATADAAGSYSVLVQLTPGINTLEATAANSGGESPRSTGVTVVFDDSVPEPPRQVTASPREGGAIRIVWYAAGDVSLSGVAGYHVYRAATPFDLATAATRITSVPEPNLLRVDVPATDGTWYYRVTTLNKAGTESLLSTLAMATSDSVAPTASLVFTPLGPTAGGRVGVGPVDVTATFSEPLGTNPFLSLAPTGGLPMPIALSAESSTVYTGRFDITDGTPSGVATAVLSIRDLVNNRGTVVTSGASLMIDTSAPDITLLEINPQSPIQTDANQATTVQVTITLSEPLPEGESPSLQWTLTSSAPVPEDLALAATGPTTFTGGITLPLTAGVIPETLVLTYTGVDDLGNVSHRVDGESSAEVYQGDLPPLSAPLALTGKALPGGKALLTWGTVPGASGYVLYRQGPLESALVEITRVSASPFQEDPGPDGAYRYAVASVRTANNEDAVSPLSSIVTVTVDGVSPPAPTALAAILAKNGIALSWQASATAEPVTYALYRAVENPITSVVGRTPMAEKIPGTVVVDPTPSLSEHAYVVLAVDGAGNRSNISNTTYLNPGLLPVSSLSVAYEVGTFPTISWAHARPLSQLAGFRITTDGVALPDLVPAFTWLDTTYDGLSREYGITTVDPGGFESLERSVVLPDIRARLGDGATIRRGVIDVVPLILEASEPVADARVTLLVGGRTSVSEAVDVEPGIPTEVTVVVGGQPSFDDYQPIRLTVALSPEVGTSVSVTDTAPGVIGDDLYVLALENRTFTRGITGQARFSFTNVGSADVDLVTASGTGNQPSSEIRLVLTDTDGNALSTAAMKQPPGPGLLTLGNGQVVARIQPGATFQSDWLTVPVPVGAPDDVVVRLVIDTVHHRADQAGHATVPGLSTSLPVSLVLPPYRAVIASAAPATSFGEEPIVILGTAIDTATEAAAPGVPVAIVIATSGFERRFDVFAGPDGAFRYEFVPLANEGGIYQIWATHPDVTDKTVQASFVVQRVLVGPSSASLQLASSYPHTLPVKVGTSPGTQLSGLSVRGQGVPLGVTLGLPTPIVVNGAGTWTLPVVVTADNTAPASSTFDLIVENGTRIFGTIPVAYTVTQAKPALDATPPGLETGVARGSLVSEVITLSNKGLAPFKNLSLSLVNASKTGGAPAWAFIASAKTLPDLAVGAKSPVTISFAPPATVPLTTFEPLTVFLRVTQAGQTVADIPLYVWIDDSGKGDQLFKVTDLYTGTLDKTGKVIEGVSGSKIQLDKQFGEPFTIEKTTDLSGEALFIDLPVGTYKYRVIASGHPASAGTVVVKAGVTGTTEVFLSTDLVTIEWEVKETTIEDKYTIILQATFETDVPAAVVTVDPGSVAIPDGMKIGEALTGQMTFTNHGLIRADDVLPKLPTSPDFKFELQGAVPNVLNAKQKVTVGYRVTRLTASTTGSDSGGGCVGVTFPMTTCYGYKCINGQYAKDCTTFWWSHVYGTCPSGPGGGGGGGWSWGGWGGGGYSGGGYGPGGGGYTSPSGQGQPVPGTPGCDPCEHPDLSSAQKDCCKANKAQPASSTVDLITGRYEDDALDMSVGVLGHDLKLERYYYDDRWHIRFIDAGLGIVETSGQIAKLTLLGVTYVPADATRTVFQDGKGANTIRVTATGYRWTDRLANTRDFDATGRLVRFADRNDRFITVEYDAKGRLARLRDTNGTIAYEYGYDTTDRVISVTEPTSGRVVGYGWTGTNLTTVTDVLGRVTTYAYDAKGRMTDKRYPSGKVTQVTYAASGVVASILDGEGIGMYLDYGYNGTTQQNWASVLRSDGSLREKWFDKYGRVVQETLNGAPLKALDTPGLAVIDKGGNVVGGKDTDGQQVQAYVRDAFGQTTKYTDRRGIVTTYAYDAKGNLTERVIGAGRADARRVTFEVDAFGRRTKETHFGGVSGQLVFAYEYDARGNLTKFTNPEGAVALYTWNTQRQALSQTNPAGDVTSFTYDAGGRRITKSLLPAGATEPVVLEAWTYASVLDAEGKIAGEKRTLTDQAGRSTVFQTDTHGRQTQVVDPEGRATRTEYDADNRVVSEKRDDGYVKSFVHEALAGGKSRSTEKVGETVVAVAERDAYGRVSKTVEQGVETIYVYDGANRQPAQIQNPGLTEVLAYDSLENLVTRTLVWSDGESVVESFDYQGTLLTRFTNGAGGGQVATLDAQGNAIQATHGADITEKNETDGFGRLIRMVDGRGGQAVKTAYAKSGAITRREVAGGIATDITLDAHGRPTVHTRNDGTELRHTYDSLGQETRIAVYPDDATTPSLVIDRAFDAQGRLVSITNGAQTSTVAYDDLARTRVETVDFGPFQRQFGYRFDSLGRKTAFFAPDGTETTYEYAPDGRLSAVKSPSFGAVTLAHPSPYDTVVSYPNGVDVTTLSGARFRTERITAKRGAVTRLDLQYDWTAHRLTRIQSDTGDTTFGYDDDDQIVSASHPAFGGLTYGYDASGNRTSSSQLPGATWAVDAANRLQSIGSGTTFEYDGVGNLDKWVAPGRTLDLEWNEINQLVRVTDGTGVEVARYTYDAKGLLAKRQVAGATTYYLYADEGLVAEYDGAGQEKRSYVWEPDVDWQSALVAQRTGADWAFPILDRTSTVVGLTDAAGALVYRAEHAPFLTATVDASSTVDTPLRGSSQLYFAETGLHYNRFRWYAPTLGRYLSIDPLAGTVNRHNLYLFADNNPVLLADRSGLDIGGGITIGNDGTVTGGVSGSAGGYAGLGGEVSGGIEATIKDCCKEEPGKPAVVIKGGESCITIKVGVEGGIGVGANGGVASATAKLATAGYEESCSLCNKCGTTDPTFNCCKTFSIKVGTLSANLFILQGEINLLTLEYKVCYGSDGFKHGGSKNGPSFKGGLGFPPKGGDSGGSGSSPAGGGGGTKPASNTGGSAGGKG